ncbi:MAG TPA: hypothetical protein VGO07_06580 [Candidatus Saccharimonadales bacterium]|jgi:hypothetical protein|nr:hypothetical protein [Candidatus Saccharimonadales bacterium]
MDPNSNQPDGQPPATPPINPTTPDWQQGLGSPAPQPPAPAGTVNPATPGVQVNQSPSDQPGSMPAGQPANWPQPDTPVNLPAAPAPGPALPPLGGPNPMMSPAPKKKIPQLFIVIGVVVVVLAIVAASYFLFLKGNGSSTDAAKKSSAAATGADDMSKLAHVTLNVPATITGYKSRSTGVDTIKDFISDDGNCEFIAGAVTAAQLPGADLNAIVDPQLKTLREGGATVNGPNAGSALILKENGSSKTYAMPTLNFEFSQAKKHAAVHYSAVILSSTDRAVVNRTCVNKDGAIDVARLAALDTVAKSVTITVKP